MKGDDEFFMYLSSNHSKEDYLENKPSAFTNRISPCHLLENEYEVALENIMFKKSYVYIKKHDPEYFINVSVKFYDMSGIVGGGTSVKYTCQKDISGASMTEVAQKVNNDLLEYLIKERLVSNIHDNLLQFDYDGRFIRINHMNAIFDSDRYITSTSGLTLSDKFKSLFGVNSVQNSLHDKIEVGYIYCDVVEPSVVGNQSVHLLDILPLSDKMFSKTRTLLMFKRVSVKFIDSISVKITDAYGKSLPFADDVIVTIVLHFKRRF